MPLLGFVQLGISNWMFGHRFEERFPFESVAGIRTEWARLEKRCFDWAVGDIGNNDLFDIHLAMQRQVRTCKAMLANSAAASIDEVKVCHQSVEAAYSQCKEAASIPENKVNGGELSNEQLLS